MFAAAIGVLGVVIGVLLSYGLSVISSRRRALTDTLAGMFALSAQVIVAHERLYELTGYSTPPVASNEVTQALMERNEAYERWCVALARFKLLIQKPGELWGPIYDFDEACGRAIAPIRLNLRLGVNLQSAEDADTQKHACDEMHDAQRIMITMGRSLLFTERIRRFTPNPKAAFRSRRIRRELEALSPLRPRSFCRCLRRRSRQ
jgi:hypothetical protein